MSSTTAQGTSTPPVDFFLPAFSQRGSLAAIVLALTGYFDACRVQLQARAAQDPELTALALPALATLETSMVAEMEAAEARAGRDGVFDVHLGVNSSARVNSHGDYRIERIISRWDAVSRFVPVSETPDADGPEGAA